MADHRSVVGRLERYRTSIDGLTHAVVKLIERTGRLVSGSRIWEKNSSKVKTRL